MDRRRCIHWIDGSEIDRFIVPRIQSNMASFYSHTYSVWGKAQWTLCNVTFFVVQFENANWTVQVYMYCMQPNELHLLLWSILHLDLQEV